VTIGVVGIGIMGRALVGRLLEQGQRVVLHNRTRDKVEDLLAQGAQWAASGAEVATQSDVTHSFVTDASAVEQVSLEPNGILAGLGPESVHVEMSTVAPASAMRLAEIYRQRERRLVQAPVLGSKNQIASGTLLVFAGGAEEDIARCEPVLRLFAGRIWHLPTAAQAAYLKLACNMLIGHMILGLGQSMLFAERGGVAPSLLLEVLAASALGSPMYSNKGKTLLERNFANPNFLVRNMLKDMNLASETAADLSLTFPHQEVTRALFLEAAKKGFGEEDYSAVVQVLEALQEQRMP
jgi:3-hydroxyisobutyrate dehydrogenase-like beta-hydroxyacid dehydrogenase